MKTLFLSAVLLGGFATSGFASIKRTCDGAYKAEIDVNTTRPLKATIYHFQAKASCSRWDPNTCRSRAKRALKNCMVGHWDNREDVDYQKCYADNVDVSYSLEIPEYYLENSLEDTVKQRVCDRLERSGYDYLSSVKVKLTAKTWGDTKCGSNHLLARSYKVKCF